VRFVFPFSGSPGKKEKMNISIKEETLGQRIRAQRIRLGMTQEELAGITFIHKPTISNYENDRIDIKSSAIAELAKALETDPNCLILGKKRQLIPDLRLRLKFYSPKSQILRFRSCC